VRSHAVRRIAGARSPRTAVLIDDQGERLICTYTIPRSTTIRRGCQCARLRAAARCSRTCVGARAQRSRRMQATVLGLVGVTLGAEGFGWLD